MLRILLLDKSVKASSRVALLKKFDTDIVHSVEEIAGETPDFVLVDESFGVSATKELAAWGLSVIVLAERVTIALRRKHQGVTDMLSDKEFVSWVDGFAVGEDGSKEETEPAEEQQNSLLGVATLNTKHADIVTEQAREAQEAVTVSAARYVAPTREPFSKARVIAVAPLRSWGGGAGKTEIVFNLAAFAAANQMRRVLVIDLDPNGPLGAYVESREQMTTDHWANLYQANKDASLSERAVLDNTERTEKYGFYMISCGVRESIIDENTFKWILTQARPYFDLILFDAPTVITKTISDMLLLADEIVTVGLYDSVQYKGYVRTLNRFTNPLVIGADSEKMKVLLNRAYPSKTQDIEMIEISKNLGIEIVLTIPEDAQLHNFRNAHAAEVLEKPSADFAKAVIPLFDELLSGLSHKENLPAIIEHKSIFQRLFGSKKKPSREIRA